MLNAQVNEYSCGKLALARRVQTRGGSTTNRAFSRCRQGGGRGRSWRRGSVGAPGLRGCGDTRRPSGPGAPARRPVPGDKLVSLATVLFLFIETLSGLIIRSLQQLLLLAIVGK